MSICFSKEFLLENMMGPNAVTMCEELTKDLPLSGCRRILDLGCGKGLSSLFLADRLDAEVFAVDLWTPASENLARFEQMGYGDRIVPLHAGAEALPFADGYFDAVVSIDAYHYFGREKGFLDAHIAPLVKEGGMIALAFPGLKQELAQCSPKELFVTWSRDDLETMHSVGWWRSLLCASAKTRLISIGEMACFEESWNDWLSCDNPYAVGDRKAMDAGAGKHMNLIAAVCQRIRSA